ncbi:hypothetical protein QNA08_06800 [Chelatococcus sp. SYSU_G07232]|uniref:AsnC family transcriptional regulator n=2 Tax=Chelatococcus albus TaxID=3047466 RepID=A0ABT7AEZ9_9HYPH|nr:hypothetical protein [Chelatococcus sp. SYSU_G07232]MDJ1157941.1 hypothetical protein [Chelatococcus sp. SYSU_G07232]
MEPARFQVERLFTGRPGELIDVSHLIDRSYDYHSVRELHWHLAERFGLPVQHVAVRRAGCARPAVART